MGFTSYVCHTPVMTGPAILMRRGWLVLVLAAGCGARRGEPSTQTAAQQSAEGAAGSTAATTSVVPPVSTTPPVDASGDAGPGEDLPVPPLAHAGPAPMPSEEEIRKEEQCSQLQDDAREAFEAASQSVQVQQCAEDADCGIDQGNESFYADRDACWAACSVIPGTPEYVEALRSSGASSCAEFRAAGCVVFPSGCPLPPSPPVWRCADAKCVVTWR